MSEKVVAVVTGHIDQQFTELAPVLDKYAKVPGSLITILQKAQDIYGYLPWMLFITYLRLQVSSRLKFMALPLSIHNSD